jgi:8-oxo-dGTP diphosphatase
VAGDTVTGRIVVTAAVIERDDAFLVTRRPRGVHLEGCWEFPGGKCEADESHDACLQREIREELDAGVRVVDEILSVTHEYPDRIVELHFLRCELLSEPKPMLGQEMRWITRSKLSTVEFPPADAELIAVLTAWPRAGGDGGHGQSVHRGGTGFTEKN